MITWRKTSESVLPDACSLSLFLMFGTHLSCGVGGTFIPCPSQRTPILKPQKIDTVLHESARGHIDE